MTDPNLQPNPAQIPATAPPKRSWKQRLFLWLGGAVLVLLVLFFLYRWAGTSQYRGVVQRVYEKSNDYRAEIVDLEGNVHVVANNEIKFPYFKLDTADLHAELNRLSRTRDVVDVTEWGFRFSWFSTFPNVIGVQFVMSRQDRDRQRAEKITAAVLQHLRDKQILKGGDGVKDEVVKIVEETLTTMPE